jgi:hypothetical protein
MEDIRKGITDVRELSGVRLRVLCLDCTEHRSWDRVLGNEIAIRKLDLASDTALDGLTPTPGGIGAAR